MIFVPIVLGAFGVQIWLYVDVDRDPLLSAYVSIFTSLFAAFTSYYLFCNPKETTICLNKREMSFKARYHLFFGRAWERTARMDAVSDIKLIPVKSQHGYVIGYMIKFKFRDGIPSISVF